MKKLKHFFDYTSEILKKKYDLSAVLDHPGLKGQCREEFIQDFLDKAFPNKFVIGTGKIIDSAEAVSNQADIIIYDEKTPVFDYGEVKHFLSCGVLAHIEVKSTIEGKELENALKIVSSVKRLRRDFDETAPKNSGPRGIFSCIFAYDGPQNVQTVFKKINSYYAKIDKLGQGSEDNVDAVCVLNKYVIIKKFLGGGECGGLFPHAGGPDSLMLFFNTLFRPIIRERGSFVPGILNYFVEPDSENESFMKYRAPRDRPGRYYY